MFYSITVYLVIYINYLIGGSCYIMHDFEAKHLTQTCEMLFF